MSGAVTSRAKHETKVAIEILDVRLTVEGELVLAKGQGISGNQIVEGLGTSEIRNRETDVVDPDDFSHDREMGKRLASYIERAVACAATGLPITRVQRRPILACEGDQLRTKRTMHAMRTGGDIDIGIGGRLWAQAQRAFLPNKLQLNSCDSADMPP